MIRTLVLALVTPAAAVLLAATAHAAPASSIPGDGTFVVGTDIQPGIYHSSGPAAGDDYCYWERDKDLNGTLDSIIANDNSAGPVTVQISATDAAFHTNGCTGWTMVAPAPAPAPEPETAPQPAPAPAPAPPATGSFGSS